MTERIINTDSELELWITFLRGKKLPITVSSIDGRDRTLDQNRLQFLWANEAAEQRGDTTVDEVQREWKLRYGVPILREDSAEFRDVYDRTIKPLTYEQKVDAMRFIDVTSTFKVRQMVRFLDTVQRECLQAGIKLTDPDPSLASYQARYRNTQSEEAA